MYNLVFYFITSFMFMAIIREAMSIFFLKREVSFSLSLIVWTAFYFIEVIGTNVIKIPMLTLLFEILSSLILCSILYIGSLRAKLIWIVLINLFGMITESIVGYTFFLFHIRLNQVQALGSFISKIILLMLLVTVKACNQSRLKRDVSFLYWLILFLIPVGSIFVINTLFTLCEQSDNKDSAILALCSSALIFGFNFLVFYIYEKLSDRLEIKKQQIIFDKQIELCRTQIQEREVSNQNIRNIKHDIKNHFICIRGYLEKGDMASANKYIDNLMYDDEYFKHDYFVNSGNVVIDTLLNYKNSIIESIGAKMHTHIEVPEDLELNDADICIILGNCLDNSIEAVGKIENEDKREVWIDIVYRKDTLLIKIANPYIGEIRKDRQGNYITTKQDAENHGIGLSSVMKAAKKYDGLVSITSDDNKFSVSTLLYIPRKNYI